MTLKSRFLPWQPKLVFSGYSYYTVDSVYGKIASQRDVWDAIQDNSSPSVSHQLQRRLLHITAVLGAVATGSLSRL